MQRYEIYNSKEKTMQKTDKREKYQTYQLNLFPIYLKTYSYPIPKPKEQNNAKGICINLR